MVPVRTSGKIDEGHLFQQMANSLSQIIAPDKFARWLSQWGFVWWETPVAAGSEEYYFRIKVMGRYAMAVGKAALRAVLEERVKLEKDRVEHERQ